VDVFRKKRQDSALVFWITYRRKYGGNGSKRHFSFIGIATLTVVSFTIDAALKPLKTEHVDSVPVFIKGGQRAVRFETEANVV
jgi:hypothetical protein